jgi:hypothetical protein
MSVLNTRNQRIEKKCQLVSVPRSQPSPDDYCNIMWGAIKILTLEIPVVN